MGNQTSFSTDQNSGGFSRKINNNQILLEDIRNPFEVAKIIQEWCVNQGKREKNLGRKKVLNVAKAYLKCFLSPEINFDIKEENNSENSNASSALESTRLLLALHSFLKVLTFNHKWDEPGKIYQLLTDKLSNIKMPLDERTKDDIGLLSNESAKNLYQELTTNNEDFYYTKISEILNIFLEIPDCGIDTDEISGFETRFLNGFTYNYYGNGRLIKQYDDKGVFLEFEKNKKNEGEVIKLLVKIYNHLHKNESKIQYTQDGNLKINGNLKIYFIDEDSEIKNKTLAFGDNKNNNNEEGIPNIDSFEVTNNNDSNSNANLSAQPKNNTAHKKLGLFQQKEKEEAPVDNNQEAIELKIIKNSNN